MTDKELDKARAKEAWRIWSAVAGGPSSQEIAARLAREGWMPVDPDLIEARECVALVLESCGFQGLPKDYRNGKQDDAWGVKAALLAIRRAKERANG